MVGGVVYDTYGPQVLFWSCAVLSGVGMAILATSRLIVIACMRSEAAEPAGSTEDLTVGDTDNIQEENTEPDAYTEDCDGDPDRGNIQEDLNAWDDEPLIKHS